MNSDFTACSTCQVERLASTLDGNGQCPFCVDEGVPPPVPPTPPAPEPKYAQVTVVPSKNAGPRAKSDAPAIPRAARAEDQQAVNEAYTLPYAAPIFDIKKAEADPAKELALRALCRRRLLPFVQRFRPKYLAGWVHEDICRRLERFVRAVEAGESPRLLLLLPPRSGKSELGSRNFPPWVLGQHPDWEIIAASHTQSLTLSFSRYVRDLVRDPAYKAIFPDLMLDPASQSIENWNTLQGGGYMAAGVGTGISGRGCFSRNTLLRSHTLSDILPISHVRVGEMVYGYDHRTGCVKEVEVLAISLMRTRKQLYAIEDVVCTDDHYFHTPDERSYTRARALDSNMSLLRRTEVQGVENVPCVLLPEPADTLDWQGMPEVRGQEGRPRIRVQKLPHGASTSRPHRDSDLHALRKDVRAESSRARGGDQEIRRAGHLLLDGVLPGSSKARDEGEGSVRGVRGTSEEVGSEKVLLAYLLPGHKEGSVYENDLQPGLLNAEEAPDQPEGSCLRDVRAEDVPSGGAPHRPRPGAQQGRELGAVVLSVSQVVSHTRGVCAGDLEAFVQDEDGELVVDIQTETGNFFVGVADLLAHNCHILVVDDVVKDAEAADSVTIRENTWEWYISTAYTRLAPGGGVLGILCMTGDTPVLMADGTQRRLDSLSVSDEIATYDRGRLATSRIKGLRSNGRDSVLKITTISGKIVRANERHPFLTVTNTGELTWTRTRNLTTAHRIVTVKGNGVSGKEQCASQETATQKWFAEGTASHTTPKSGGQTVIDQPLTVSDHVATPGSSTGMGSLSKTMTLSMRVRAVAAPSVENQQMLETPLATGSTSSPSTIATTQVRSEACCATTAMQGLDTLELSQWHFPQPGTSDFTLDEIVAIESDGVEEVFDLQVERTENFIANGLVSHNTWWHEDDWAGRIQDVMKSGDGDVFEVVKYPAINEEGDEYILPDDTIQQFAPESDPPPEGSRLTRLRNTAIHPARYTTAMMVKIKMNLISSGLKRVWNALYQQNPVPDDGVYFTKEMMRWYTHPPRRQDMFVYQAWDFAITEKTDSDWTVCCTLGQDEADNLYVLHILRFRSGDGNAIVDDILDQYEMFKPDLIGFEDGQIWKSLTSQFKKRCDERKLYPNSELLQPLTDKKVRAGPLKGRMQNGKLFVRQNQPWTEQFRQELMKFPSGKYDDVVDSTSWAVRLTLTKSAPKAKAPPPQKSWKDKLRELTSGQGGHMAA